MPREPVFETRRPRRDGVDRNRADRRSRRLILTSAGRDLLAAALPLWQREHAAIDRSFAETDEDRLRADLRALA